MMMMMIAADDAGQSWHYATRSHKKIQHCDMLLSNTICHNATTLHIRTTCIQITAQLNNSSLRCTPNHNSLHLSHHLAPAQCCALQIQGACKVQPAATFGLDMRSTEVQCICHANPGTPATAVQLQLACCSCIHQAAVLHNTLTSAGRFLPLCASSLAINSQYYAAQYDYLAIAPSHTSAKPGLRPKPLEPHLNQAYIIASHMLGPDLQCCQNPGPLQRQQTAAQVIHQLSQTTPIHP
jgi:hypothetical protein